MQENLEKRIKRQVHGKLHRFTAVVPLGFEATLVQELRQIGVAAKDDSFETADGKVSFEAKLTEAWKAVAHSRIANRVLMDIASFMAENFRELEKKAAEIPWELYLDERTLASSLQTKDERNNPSISELVTSNSLHIHVTCKHSRLYHSDAVAERFYNVFKGGSLPLVRTASLSTPSAGTPRNAPPQDKPSSQNIFVTLIDDRCTVSLDLAGEELYKRGHQRFVNDAPLKETIAAAMLFEAIHCSKGEARPHTSKPDMSGDLTTLIDPMAGSGTFSLEAAYMASGIIPGKCRDFALKHQPAFKEASWNYIVNSALRKNGVSNLSLRGNEVRACHERSVVVAITSPIHKILTSDISDKAVEIIRHNVECSPLAKIEPTSIAPQQKDFFSYTPEEISNIGHDTSNGSRNARVIIVLNPPYGKRLDTNAPALYGRIGKKLSELAQGIGRPLVVAILAPKGTCTDNLLKNCAALGLPSTKVIKTSHGGISLNCFIGKI